MGIKIWINNQFHIHKKKINIKKFKIILYFKKHKITLQTAVLHDYSKWVRGATKSHFADHVWPAGYILVTPP